MWTLELIAGKIFIPVAWIMGVERCECEKVAQLIGIKTMVNEFVAFSRMGDMVLSVIYIYLNVHFVKWAYFFIL